MRHGALSGVAARGAGLAGVIGLGLLAGCAADAGRARVDLDAADGSAFAPRIDVAKVERKREKYDANGPKRTDAPGDAQAYWYAQRLGPGMTTYPMAEVQAIAREVRFAGAARGVAAPAVAGIERWQEIGPGNVGGRTRAILINPDNRDIMYAAGVAGGVFKSLDAGASWNPTDDFLANIAVNSMAMDPSDPDTIYAGTGEGFFNGDAVRGLGIFKTTDGGATWTQLPGTLQPQVDSGAFYRCNKLQVSSLNPNHVYAATRFGVYRSLDAGATWTNVLSNTVFTFNALNTAGGTSVGATDIQIAPGGAADTLYAAFGSFGSDGLYRSRDGGDTWTRLGTPGDLDTSFQGRMTIAVAPSDPDIVYVAMASSSDFGAIGQMVDVFRSTDGGDTWAPRLDVNAEASPFLFSNFPFGNGCFDTQFFNQGWYDNIIKVDPLDPDIVWVGGIDLFRSDDGARTFKLASYWYFASGDPNELHADQHEIVFHPDYNGTTNQTMYVGNDGGVYRTDNARAATTDNTCPFEDDITPLPEIVWIDLNNGYGTTQFYHGDSATTADRFIGGTQDNGTNRSVSRAAFNAWDEVLGGDGGYVQIDPTNPDVVFAETQRFPSIFRSLDGGDSFSSAVNGITDDDGLFITPFYMDPSNPGVLWSGGRRPWRTTDQADNWEAVGPNFDGPATLSAIASAPTDPDRVYLGFSDGYVVTTTNGLAANPTWVIRAIGLPTEQAFISDLAVDPTDPDAAYATTSTFGVDHVYRTTDGGATWTSIDGINDIAGVIPDIPVHSIAVLPSNPAWLYAGTEVGVFATEDGGATWRPANLGLANTVVEELDFQDGDTLVAFTHGRGAFLTDLNLGGGPCSPADLAELFGTLDVADVVTFLQRFGAGDPSVDFGLPTGQLDVADVVTFLQFFGEGCP